MDRLGGRLHQQSVAVALVGAQHRPEFLGHRDGDVEVGRRQHLELARLKPALGLVGVALGAAPVLARVVGEDLSTALVTAPGVAAERLGAAGEDVGDGAPVRRRHRRAMDRLVVIREAAEDLRDLDHG